MVLDGIDYGRGCVYSSWIMFFFVYAFRAFYVYVEYYVIKVRMGPMSVGRQKTSQDALVTRLVIIPLARIPTEHTYSTFPRHTSHPLREQLFHFHVNAPSLLPSIFFPAYHISCPVCTTI